MIRLSLLLMAALASTAIAAPKRASTATASAKVTDWSRVTSESPAGGFVMGNPKAKVKLIEFGSLTCSHCRAFDEAGVPPLIATYVKSGKVSWEFRSFLLNGFDIPATLTARCAGANGFFPMMRALYASQLEWIAKVQAIPADRMTAIQAMTPAQQFVAIGQAAGFPQFGAARGIASTRINACLADKAQADRIVAMTGDAAKRLKVGGTPTFMVNGAKVDYSGGPTPWAVVSARLDAALKS